MSVPSLFTLASRKIEALSEPPPPHLEFEHAEAIRRDKINYILFMIPYDQDAQMYEIAKFAFPSEFREFLDTHPYALNDELLLKGIAEGDNIYLFEYVLSELSIDILQYLYILERSRIIWEQYVLPELTKDNVPYRMFYDVNLNVCTYVCEVTRTDKLRYYFDMDIDHAKIVNVNYTVSYEDVKFLSGSLELYLTTTSDPNMAYENFRCAIIGGRQEIMEAEYQNVIQLYNSYLHSVSDSPTNDPQFLSLLFQNTVRSNIAENFLRVYDKFSIMFPESNRGPMQKLFLIDDGNYSRELSLDEFILQLAVEYGCCNIIDAMLAIKPNLNVNEKRLITRVNSDTLKWAIALNVKNRRQHITPKLLRDGSLRYWENILVLNKITGFNFFIVTLNPIVDGQTIEILRRHPSLVKEVNIQENFLLFDKLLPSSFLSRGNVEAFRKYYRKVAAVTTRYNRIQQAYNNQDRDYREIEEEIPEEELSEEELRIKSEEVFDIVMEKGIYDIAMSMIEDGLIDVESLSRFPVIPRLMERRLQQITQITE